MMKKKYLFILIVVIVIIIVALLFGIYVGGTARNTVYKNNSSQATKNILFNNLTYQVVAASSSPNSSEQVVQAEIMQLTQRNNPTQQTFIIKNALDGSMRQLVAFDQKDITFEKIKPQNWSPTNRFVYEYVDYPNRRDIVFLKTDGTFTNAQFYLHSTGMYPDINVLSAQWIDESTLELQTTDIKTQQPFTYIVNFDDDSGTISQCPGGPNTCNVGAN